MSSDSDFEQEIVHEFLVESQDNLDQLDRDLVALEQNPTSRELLGSVFRTIHTIKGTSGFLAFGRLESLAHVGENVLARLRDGALLLDPEITTVLLRMVDAVRGMLAHIEADGTEGDAPVDDIVAALQQVLEPRPAVAAAAPEPRPEPSPEPAPVATPEPAPAVATSPVPAAATSAPTAAAAETNPDVRATETSIRVDVDLLETLVRLAGELVLARNQIVQRAAGLGDEELNRVCHRLDQVTSELQEGVMRTRMQPIDHVWSKLPRVVRDLGTLLGRQVDLRMDGGDTELDRTLLEAVKDPLTHLVRNAVDHGIEPPEERADAGKPVQGVLHLRAFHEGGQIVVEVADDGRGLDPVRIGQRAVERGLVRAEALPEMSANDIQQFVFIPGFSTAATVTNVSGRGVGMDVVRTNIERIGGSIEVESEPGVSTVWRLRIPLTLAIVPALKLVCSEQRFAIPQTNLLELVDLPAGTGLETVGGAEVYRLRGSLLPILRLGSVLGLPPSAQAGEAGIVVAVLESDGRRFGLVVDRVLDTEDIVVKPVAQAVKDIGLFAGATIMGDGRVSLILDVQNLTRRAMRAGDVARTSHSVAADSRRETARGGSRLLVVDAGGGHRVAIPLAAVTRLEQFERSTIERVGHREVVRYRGQIMPLTRLSSHLGALSSDDAETVAGVVYTENGRSVALAVEKILDIESDDGTVFSDIDDPGLVGSALIRDRVTGMLDVRAAILAADPRFYESLTTAPTEHAEVPA